MKIIFNVALILVLLALPFILEAQPFPEDGTPPCDGPFGSPCPIDGGIGFLIAAGIAYGGKKAHDITRRG
jgi:hypothetical protein